MIKKKEIKVVYDVDAQKTETKKAEITIEFDVIKNRVTFCEKGKPLFWVSACDADALAKKFKSIHKECGDVGGVNVDMGRFVMPILDHTILKIS